MPCKANEIHTAACKEDPQCRKSEGGGPPRRAMSCAAVWLRDTACSCACALRASTAPPRRACTPEQPDGGEGPFALRDDQLPACTHRPSLPRFALRPAARGLCSSRPRQGPELRGSGQCALWPVFWRPQAPSRSESGQGSAPRERTTNCERGHGWCCPPPTALRCPPLSRPPARRPQFHPLLPLPRRRRGRSWWNASWQALRVANMTMGTCQRSSCR